MSTVAQGLNKQRTVRRSKVLSDCCEFLKGDNYDIVCIQFDNYWSYLGVADETLVNESKVTQMERWEKYITKTLELPVEFDKANNRISFYLKDYTSIYNLFIAFTIVRFFYERASLVKEIFKLQRLCPELDPIQALWTAWWYLNMNDNTRGLGYCNSVQYLPTRAITLKDFVEKVKSRQQYTVVDLFKNGRSYYDANNGVMKSQEMGNIIKKLAERPIPEEQYVEYLKELKVL